MLEYSAAWELMIEKQRHKYFLTCLAVSIPTLAYFGVIDMLGGRMVDSVFVFALCAIFSLFLVIGLRRKMMSTLLIDLSKALFGFFLLFLTYSGLGEGYGILWAYVFPLASFYLPGKREALVWTAGFYVAMVMLLLFPGFFGGMVYEKPLVLRFLFSFFIVSILTYSYAMIREKLHAGLQKELEEKDMLLKEIHHRVKNNLTVVQSILGLQCGAVSDEASRSVFLESESRINSMSLLHEALYSQGESSQIEVSGYLGKVIEHLSDAYKSENLKAEVSIDIPETWFDVELAMPCGIIVNEMLTNSFKYAASDSGEVRAEVSLVRGPDDKYALSVRDSGRGLPEGFDINSGETYGFQIVSAFVEQIGGNIDVMSGPEGTVFRLTFSPPESPRQKTPRS
jgi:two-component sensor histidine kinase